MVSNLNTWLVAFFPTYQLFDKHTHTHSLSPVTAIGSGCPVFPQRHTGGLTNAERFGGIADREAQRNIRERNKALIEELRAKIAALESQQPYQDLQAVLRAKEAVEAENADIKRRLVSIISTIQPLISSPGSLPHPSHRTLRDLTRSPPTVNHSNYASPAQGYLPVQQPAPPAPSSFHNASTPTSAASPASVSVIHGQGHHWHGDLIPPGPPPPPPPPNVPAAQSKLLDQQRQEYVHGLDMGTGERLGLDFLLGAAQRVNKIQSGPDGAQDTPHFHHVPMKHDWTSATHVHGPFPFGGGGGGGGQNQEDAPRLEYGQGMSLAAAGASSGADSSYPSQIKNCAPTCPLDSLLLDFLSERRQRAAEGLPTQEIIGPKYPSVSSLLNPANSQFSHPLSKVFTDILQTFPDLSGLPERVATLYIMFLVMRWQINPSSENYDRLPSWMAPGAAQLEISHPAWFDYLPFPRMRERLIRTHGSCSDAPFPFDNFFIPFTTTLSLNWPYEDVDALLLSPDTDEIMVNPVFERHLRRPENWSLGDSFAMAFPNLAGTYNLKSESSNMGVQVAK